MFVGDRGKIRGLPQRRPAAHSESEDCAPIERRNPLAGTEPGQRQRRRRRQEATRRASNDAWITAFREARRATAGFLRAARSAMHAPGLTIAATRWPQASRDFRRREDNESPEANRF